MRAAISDKKGGRLAVFDLATFTRTFLVEDVGRGAYPCDAVGKDLVYVSTRGEQFVRPVDIARGVALDPIELGHAPRSTTYNAARDVAFVGGADRVVVSVVDVKTGKVLRQVGSQSTDPRRDYGGSLACGHPAVGPGGELFLLDRVARRIEAWDPDEGTLLASVNLPSSPHHAHAHDGVYYALCEGNRQTRTPPSVVAFTYDRGGFRVRAHGLLPVLSGDWASTGGHHLTVDSTRGRVYVGTAASWLYTLDSSDLSVVYRTETGPGCGHVTLCTGTGLGVTTNHTGRAMTVFDLDTGRRVRDIVVSSPVSGSGSKTQGHTSYWDADRKRLYTTAAQDGALLELDPAGAEVTRSLDVAGADLIQGCVVS